MTPTPSDRFMAVLQARSPTVWVRDNLTRQTYWDDLSAAAPVPRPCNTECLRPDRTKLT